MTSPTATAERAAEPGPPAAAGVVSPDASTNATAATANFPYPVHAADGPSCDLVQNAQVIQSAEMGMWERSARRAKRRASKETPPSPALQSQPRTDALGEETVDMSFESFIMRHPSLQNSPVSSSAPGSQTSSTFGTPLQSGKPAGDGFKLSPPKLSSPGQAARSAGAATRVPTWREWAGSMMPFGSLSIRESKEE